MRAKPFVVVNLLYPAQAATCLADGPADAVSRCCDLWNVPVQRADVRPEGLFVHYVAVEAPSKIGAPKHTQGHPVFVYKQGDV